MSDSKTPNAHLCGKTSDHHVFLNKMIKNPNIIVGDHTYYHDFVDPYCFEKLNAGYFPCEEGKDKLMIGKFCSIAHGARFLSSVVNHPIDGFSSYPFSVMWSEEETGYKYTYPKKGDTLIGNDVWICSESTIMPGVHIGDGAVIGTRAVVTKDVEPYAVVGGNPAQLIRKRFNPEIIEALLEIQWWNWPLEKIVKNSHILVSNDLQKLKEIC